MLLPPIKEEKIVDSDAKGQQLELLPGIGQMNYADNARGSKPFVRATTLNQIQGRVPFSSITSDTSPLLLSQPQALNSYIRTSMTPSKSGLNNMNYQVQNLELEQQQTAMNLMRNVDRTDLYQQPQVPVGSYMTMSSAMQPISSNYQSYGMVEDIHNRVPRVSHTDAAWLPPNTAYFNQYNVPHMMPTRKNPYSPPISLPQPSSAGNSQRSSISAESRSTNTSSINGNPPYWSLMRMNDGNMYSGIYAIDEDSSYNEKDSAGETVSIISSPINLSAKSNMSAKQMGHNSSHKKLVNISMQDLEELENVKKKKEYSDQLGKLRVDRRRERNRLAAKRSREKKANFMVELQEYAKTLEVENAALTIRTKYLDKLVSSFDCIMTKMGRGKIEFEEIRAQVERRMLEEAGRNLNSDSDVNCRLCHLNDYLDLTLDVSSLVNSVISNDMSSFVVSKNKRPEQPFCSQESMPDSNESPSS